MDSTWPRNFILFTLRKIKLFLANFNHFVRLCILLTNDADSMFKANASDGVS